MVFILILAKLLKFDDPDFDPEFIGENFLQNEFRVEIRVKTHFFGRHPEFRVEIGMCTVALTFS